MDNSLIKGYKQKVKESSFKPNNLLLRSIIAIACCQVEISGVKDKMFTLSSGPVGLPFGSYISFLGKPGLITLPHIYKM